MVALFARRLVQALGVLLGVAVITFLLLHFLPADPVNAGGILRRLAGGKVQRGRGQEGPRYREASCFSRFIPEERRPLAVRTWPDGSGACFGRA